VTGCLIQLCLGTKPSADLGADHPTKANRNRAGPEQSAPNNPRRNPAKNRSQIEIQFEVRIKAENRPEIASKTAARVQNRRPRQPAAN